LGHFGPTWPQMRVIEATGVAKRGSAWPQFRPKSFVGVFLVSCLCMGGMECPTRRPGSRKGRLRGLSWRPGRSQRVPEAHTKQAEGARGKKNGPTGAPKDGQKCQGAKSEVVNISLLFPLRMKSGAVQSGPGDAKGAPSRPKEGQDGATRSPSAPRGQVDDA
jgi:hypothetical protein